MLDEASQEMKRAADLWQKGQSLEAGRIVFEALPVRTRPFWAIGILRVVVARTGIECSATKNLLRVADQAANWKKAHDVFSKLRNQTLKLENVKRKLTHEEEVRARQLCLSECVAKVIYNATNPLGPFDEDSGWWIVSCLRDLVDFLGDTKFANSAWVAVSRNTWDHSG